MSRRQLLFVVSTPADAAGMPQERVLTADRYLEGREAFSNRRLVVVNLARSYRYRTKGYYVSLLADARGHQVIPSVETIEGLADPFGLFRCLQEAGIPTVDVAELRARGNGAAERAANGKEVAETLAYFGSSPDRRFQAAALAAFRDWPMPVLRLQFVHEEGEWRVAQVAPVPVHQLAAEERARFLEVLGNETLVLRRGAAAPREARRASIAVLVDEDDVFSPSSPETIDRLERVAARMNVHLRRIGLDEIARLGEYDALFIRALTGVREPAFQFALRAEALDMPVIDDSQSIIRCGNKVFLEEMLRREGIPIPRTLVVTSKTSGEQIERELGLPFVIKLPDSSFSAAVHKISSRAEYRQHAVEMLRRSPLLIVQEWLPTEFDWRITVLDGKLLFAAKYYMARGHWQIRSAEPGNERYGRVEAVPRARAPRKVVELGLRAASLIGSGLYGVDIKETPRGPVVIEINDNPNLDVGYDDAADGNAIYEDLVNFFLRRIEESGEGIEEDEEESPASGPLRQPIRGPTEPKPHYRPFEVAGIELEYPVVDRDLNVVSRVDEAFRALAGRATSDVE
ncbi:MAG TPA: RimK family protein, partial [Longimicrobiaceae bacterium]|nr:RimK family protein [Longimicrobiaceae bacterium]